MPSKHKLSSTLRRAQRADFLLRTGTVAMRPCQHCLSRFLLCVVSKHSDHCEECVRHYRQCDLAPPNYSELEKLSQQERKLYREAQEAKAKAIRLSKQRRALIKRMKEIGQREDQNILELEIDELMESEFPVDLPSQDPSVLSPTVVPRSDSPDRTSASPLHSG